MDLTSIFTPSVPALELVARGTVIFLMLLIVGQRESGGLGMTDLMVVLVADAASAGPRGSDPRGPPVAFLGRWRRTRRNRPRWTRARTWRRSRTRPAVVPRGACWT